MVGGLEGFHELINDTKRAYSYMLQNAQEKLGPKVDLFSAWVPSQEASAHVLVTLRPSTFNENINKSIGIEASVQQGLCATKIVKEASAAIGWNDYMP